MSMPMLVLVAQENIEAGKKMISNNRRITIREVADDVGILFGSSQAIFTNVLGMKSTVAMIIKLRAKTTSHGHH